MTAFCTQYDAAAGLAVEAVAFAPVSALPEDPFRFDAALPVLNGNWSARRLRGQGWRGPIVAITSSTQFYVESYEVKAVRYLVMTYDAFAAAMARVSERLSLR